MTHPLHTLSLTKIYVVLFDLYVFPVHLYFQISHSFFNNNVLTTLQKVAILAHVQAHLEIFVL